MATVQKFEELKIWQLARQIARQVYAMTQGGAFAKDFGLKDQIQRAAVSIGSNIAEGFVTIKMKSLELETWNLELET